MTSLRAYYNAFRLVAKHKFLDKKEDVYQTLTGIPKVAVDNNALILDLKERLVEERLVTPSLSEVVTSRRGAMALLPTKKMPWGYVFPRVVSQETFDAANAAAVDDGLNVASNPRGDSVMLYVCNKSEWGKYSESWRIRKQFLELRVRH
jgi:hypothetical protein